MFTSIKTSESNKRIVTDLTRKLNLGPENVIARIAFTYSLSKGKKLELSDIEDSKGKEYNRKVLFGDDYILYVSLICVHYDLPKNDRNLHRYIKMHIDDGLKLLEEELKKFPNTTGFEFLISKIEKGISKLN
jgi:DNA sulfur modification protein DndE